MERNVITVAVVHRPVEDPGDLLALNIELWPYELLAARAWELRRNLPIYDGAYVALAELIGSRLVTLDRRIGGAPGLRCGVVMP